MESCVCVIPARGGSKRIKRKNLKNFCGKPILSYSLQNAQKSGIFDKILVSSDDEEILEFAKSFGVSALRRPKDLSTDYSSTREVILHAIESLEMQEVESQDLWICCLYATAPLLDSKTLTESFLQAKTYASSCYCFGAVEYDYSPYRAFNIIENHNKMLFKEHFSKRSQDLEKIYHDAGQFYFARSSVWRNRENIFEDSVSIVLPPMRVQDIDTLEDWELAELKFKLLANSCRK